MCEALKELMKDEFEALRQEVMIQGRAEGGRQKLEEQIRKKIQKNKDINQIAEELEAEIEEILPIYQQLIEQIA